VQVVQSALMIRLGCGVILLLAAGTVPAGADIVFLTSGRTLSVETHRVEGDSLVLVLRGGGEITCDRSLVARIEPDEVPWEEPGAEVAPERTGQARVLPATPYDDIIDTVAARHGIDPALVHAVIQVESAYRPRARSPKGAMGLMQLMPATARQYKVADPYDPWANIEGGIRHLKSLLDRFELSLALAAYNAGEAAVQRFGGIPPYRETRSYVGRILALLDPR
jgi:hypothetical protein